MKISNYMLITIYLTLNLALKYFLKSAQNLYITKIVITFKSLNTGREKYSLDSIASINNKNSFIEIYPF